MGNNNKINVEDLSVVKQDKLDFEKNMRLPYRFKTLNRLILRDLNDVGASNPSFYKYTKDQIATFLKDPYRNQKNLRDASIYLYNASSHFRRLIQYFTALTDFAYVITPLQTGVDAKNKEQIRNQFKKYSILLNGMDIRNQFRKIIKVCFREDTFYGTFRVSKNNVILQQLPSDYCDIAVVEDGVLNVSFNFSYFDTNGQALSMYPEEFATKYDLYQKDRSGMKWQELNSPNSFAIKCNDDILSYSIPPLVGVFREVYDLEDYKELKLTKTELENYAMLVMKLAMNTNGEYSIPYNKAVDFWRNLDGVLPEEIGSVLSPMSIEKISFEKKNGTSEADPIALAAQQLYSAAGVSSLLFNNEKANGNALLLSIKADQAMTFNIVQSIERAINRFLNSYSYGKRFKLTFLDSSPYNRKELAEMYLKACQYGMPFASHFCAIHGLSQFEMDTMNYFEDEILNIKERFIPLQSSSTQSSKDIGRPRKSLEDLSASGEASQEQTD